MIEEKAKVVAVDHGEIEVVAIRHTACRGCAAKSGCGTSLLEAWFSRRPLSFRLVNSVNAGEGDVVRIGLDDGKLGRTAVLLYAMPLLGLIGGAIIGEGVAMNVGFNAELGAVAGGLFGLIASLFGIRLHSNKANPGGRSDIRLLGIVQRAEGIPDSRLTVPVQLNRVRELE